MHDAWHLITKILLSQKYEPDENSHLCPKHATCTRMLFYNSFQLLRIKIIPIGKISGLCSSCNKILEFGCLRQACTGFTWQVPASRRTTTVIYTDRYCIGLLNKWYRLPAYKFNFMALVRIHGSNKSRCPWNINTRTGPRLSSNRFLIIK